MKVTALLLREYTNVFTQEGYLAEHAVNDEDRITTKEVGTQGPMDPMQGLEGLDVAGPRVA